jgi:predicted metal-dependent enzyme (double-stranded beta helix superfamily)
MTFTKSTVNLPRFAVCPQENIIPFIVKSQGVFIFQHLDNSQACSFQIYGERGKVLAVEFTLDEIKVLRMPGNDILVDKHNKHGLSNKRGAYYWISVDAQNQILKAGIGEPRQENVKYSYQFPKIKDSKDFLECLEAIHLESGSRIKPIKILRDPITLAIPLLVKNTNDLTMNDIAAGKYMPSANLSVISQKLYNCIAGNKFVLDDNDFPEFSDAIEHSIFTPGLWCHETLKKKASEFGKSNPDETYLRITLGQNNGESPGVPYVMEIWPPGHYSPIHSHAGANAIIRVLHGGINVSLFPFLCEEKDGVKPCAVANFSKDDITWIAPNLNQIHQLRNIQTETCITIQCYMYDKADKSHYDYFDYLDEDGVKQQYEPDSDMDFLEFKSLMKTEYKYSV